MLIPLAATLSLLSPQQLPELSDRSVSPQMRFVDFSLDLERPGVTALIGRLGDLREGKRERMREGGQLGSGSAQVSISGTQFYRVPVRSRIEDQTVLVGPELPARAGLSFDLQLARLPDGSERRQAMTGNGAKLEEGLLALWVVEKPRRGRALALLHVVPFHAKADAGKDPDEVFADHMRDFCAVNQRVAELRGVLARTEEVDEEDREAALKELRAAAEVELEMQDPKYDALVTQHVAPLLQRVRKRIEELEDDG